MNRISFFLSCISVFLLVNTIEPIVASNATNLKILGGEDFAKEIWKMYKQGQLDGLIDATLNDDTRGNVSKTKTRFLPGIYDGPKVRFYLYNNSSQPFRSQELHIGNMTSLNESLYDPSKPVKMLIHPWMGVPVMFPLIFPYSTKNAYLLRHRGKYNVIIMDYTMTTGYPLYSMAATTGMEEAINNTLEFLQWLNEENLIDLSNTHIIGLSLGAHIGAGIANAVNRTMGVPIGRVTGLDPVGPLFFPRLPALTPPHRMHAADARYSDVAHTNALIAGLGIMKNVGQADYYLNGGISQPGCEQLGNLADAAASQGVPPGTGYVLQTICSHLIAGEYYSMSVAINRTTTSCACSSVLMYYANPACCDARAIFGENSQPGTNGTLYMQYNLLSATLT